MRYRIREVGGPELPTVVHVDALRRIDQSFELYDPDAYFQSSTACHNAIHQMLMQMLVLREFDLGTDNWDNFMPHTLASMNVRYYRHDIEKHGGRRWWCGVDVGVLYMTAQLETPREVYDEYSSKSSLGCETKVYRTSRRKNQTSEG
jgi:hypothetical protein